jgi:hypothetical protein
MDIKREPLPDHPVAGEQWVLIHQVPTHDMSLAVSEAVLENMGTPTTMKAQTVIVQQLVEDWHVFNHEGVLLPWDKGAGVGAASQAIVWRVFKLCEDIAARIVNPDDAEETPGPNRAARRRAR